MAITLASAAFLASMGTTAQERPVRQACAADLQQRCGGIEPGSGRLKACVKDNFAVLSEPCKEALLATVTLVKACKDEVLHTCPGVQPGGGRIQACMKEHFAEYSDPCRLALLTAKLGRH